MTEYGVNKTNSIVVCAWWLKRMIPVMTSRPVLLPLYLLIRANTSSEKKLSVSIRAGCIHICRTQTSLYFYYFWLMVSIVLCQIRLLQQASGAQGLRVKPKGSCINFGLWDFEEWHRLVDFVVIVTVTPHGGLHLVSKPLNVVLKIALNTFFENAQTVCIHKYQHKPLFHLQTIHNIT